MAETKRKVSGRRYSQWVERSFDTLEESLAELTQFKAFQDQVAEKVERARAFLRSRDLPDFPMMVKSRTTGEWTCYAGQAAGDLLGAFSLDHYILKVCQFKRDSFEHLAASMIVAASEMQRPERERAIEGAFRLGQLNALARVYAMESIDARNRVIGKPKHKKWGDLLAEKLAAKAARSKAEAREIIPEGSQSVLSLDEDHAVYMDGDTVCCIDPVTDRRRGTLKWESFKKRYLGKIN